MSSQLRHKRSSWYIPTLTYTTLLVNTIYRCNAVLKQSTCNSTIKYPINQAKSMNWSTMPYKPLTLLTFLLLPASLFSQSTVRRPGCTFADRDTAYNVHLADVTTRPEGCPTDEAVLQVEALQKNKLDHAYKAARDLNELAEQLELRNKRLKTTMSKLNTRLEEIRNELGKNPAGLSNIRFNVF